jgi:hypothetical protein
MQPHGCVLKGLQDYTDGVVTSADGMARPTWLSLPGGHHQSLRMALLPLWVSLRDVSELMLARGIEVSHEAIRVRTLRFGTEYARLTRRGDDPAHSFRSVSSHRWDTESDR